MTTRVFSGYTVGDKYKEDPRGCQDRALHWEDSENQRALIVVCDGAGSAKYSPEASTAISEGIRDFFVEHAGADWLANESVENIKSNHLLPALKQAFLGLVKGLRAKGKNPGVLDLGTTLLFVYTDREQGIAISGHIGDGYILRIEQDTVEFQSEAATGEFTHETYFVTIALQNPSHFRIRRTLLTNKTAGFVCMSDGLDCLIYTRRNIVDHYQSEHKCNVVFHPDLITMFTLEDVDVVEVLKRQFTENFKSGQFRTDDDTSMAVLRFMDVPLNLTSAEEGEKLQQALRHIREREFQDQQYELRQVVRDCNRLIARIRREINLSQNRVIASRRKVQDIKNKIDSHEQTIQNVQSVDVAKNILVALNSEVSSLRATLQNERNQYTKDSHDNRQNNVHNRTSGRGTQPRAGKKPQSLPHVRPQLESDRYKIDTLTHFNRLWYLLYHPVDLSNRIRTQIDVSKDKLLGLKVELRVRTTVEILGDEVEETSVDTVLEAMTDSGQGSEISK